VEDIRKIGGQTCGHSFILGHIILGMPLTLGLYLTQKARISLPLSKADYESESHGANNPFCNGMIWQITIWSLNKIRVNQWLRCQDCDWMFRNNAFLLGYVLEWAQPSPCLRVQQGYYQDAEPLECASWWAVSVAAQWTTRSHAWLQVYGFGSSTKSHSIWSILAHTAISILLVLWPN
jgi:hypothetical protein